MNKIVFNDKALKVLKSFANINSGMIFRPGNKFEVAHGLKMVLGFCDVGVTIPEKFAIYDVPKFLGVVGLHDKESVEFGLTENSIAIKSKKGKTTYRLTDTTNVVSAPEGLVLKVNNKIGDFLLSAAELDEAKSVANSLALPHILFSNVDGKLVIDVKDVKNNACDDHKIVSETPASGDFKNLLFNAEYLGMLMSGFDYQVEANDTFAHFVSTDKKMEYFVTMEKKA